MYMYTLRHQYSDLSSSQCIEEHGNNLNATPLGRIACDYYLLYKTAELFSDRMTADCTVLDLLRLLCDAHEYDELPVRHNEENLNADLAALLPYQPRPPTMDSSHTKAFLLLQAHLHRCPLPITDYITDTKTALDNSMRLIQAMIDIAAENGMLNVALSVMTMLQCLTRARWPADPPVGMLPGVTPSIANSMAVMRYGQLPVLMSMPYTSLVNLCTKLSLNAKAIHDVLVTLPELDMRWRVSERIDEDSKSLVNILVELEIKRSHPRPRKVYAPDFPKPKDEGFWIVLGLPEACPGGQLLALKRVVLYKEISSIVLSLDPSEMSHVKECQLYVISDSYIGLDHQYTVSMRPTTA